MTVGSHTLGCAFTVLLCFKLFHGVLGDCGPPPVKPNTNPVTETSGKAGETVVYTCDRSTGHYEVPNKSTTITCQDDGSWTDIEDFCIRACGVPERLQFAEPKPDALNQDIFLPNVTVGYNCRPGYNRNPGTKNSITCLENYKWSTPEEFCIRRTCGNPGDVDNANLEATDFLFGSRIEYTCNEGYRLMSRRNYRDCQADGTWSNSAPQCDAVICSAPAVPANGEYYPLKDEYNYLDSVKFECRQPFEVAGDDILSCRATGDWSSGIPTCKAVNCSDPFVKNSKRISGFIGPYKLNSAISFECEDGFVLNGSSSIKCNIDSEWEPLIPKCERVSCGDPGIIVNGQRSVSDFFIGSKATYTCDERYVLTSSLKTEHRICQKNGTWTGSTPKCSAFCKDPPTYHFATPKETSAGDHIHVTGTVLEYVCNQGFKISPGKESKITCTHHKWSAHDDFCIRILCEHPGEIKNGHVEVSDFFFGSRATYTCKEGYVRNSTHDYRECQADGTWSRPIACTDEPTPVPIWVIVVIVLVVGAVVVVIIIFVFRYISKKQKRGPTVPEIL